MLHTLIFTPDNRFTERANKDTDEATSWMQHPTGIWPCFPSGWWCYRLNATKQARVLFTSVSSNVKYSGQRFRHVSKERQVNMSVKTAEKKWRNLSLLFIVNGERLVSFKSEKSSWQFRQSFIWIIQDILFQLILICCWVFPKHQWLIKKSKALEGLCFQRTVMTEKWFDNHWRGPKGNWTFSGF